MGNADAAKNAYKAFSQGDLETLREGFAEDAEWQTSDELPLGGELRIDVLQTRQIRPPRPPRGGHPGADNHPGNCPKEDLLPALQGR